MIDEKAFKQHIVLPTLEKQRQILADINKPKAEREFSRFPVGAIPGGLGAIRRGKV